MRDRLLWLSFIILFSASCKPIYQSQSVQYKDYRINSPQSGDSLLKSMLQPYADSVNKNMNVVIAASDMDLEKKQPEGTLGNLMADAMLIMAKEKYNTPVDAAFLNSGGIRLPSIPKGNITRGKVFELMPFDNLVVLQKMDGKTLQRFLDLIADRGGWPCAGISFTIRNKKAENVIIGGKPMNEATIYTIANNDYVANGGDDAEMLKPIPQQNMGYLYRDALLQYFSRFTKEGKLISSKIENRVTNAK